MLGMQSFKIKVLRFFKALKNTTVKVKHKESSNVILSPTKFVSVRTGREHKCKPVDQQPCYRLELGNLYVVEEGFRGY